MRSAGSQRSFTGYVFQRKDLPGEPFTGPRSLLLSSILEAPRLRQATLPRMLRSRTRRAAAEATLSTSESSTQTPEVPATVSTAQTSARRSASPAATATVLASPETCVSVAPAATTGAADEAGSQKAPQPSRRVPSVYRIAAGSLRSKTAASGAPKQAAHVGKGLGALCADGAATRKTAATGARAGSLSPSKRGGIAAPQQVSPDKRTRSRALTGGAKRP